MCVKGKEGEEDKEEHVYAGAHDVTVCWKPLALSDALMTPWPLTESMNSVPTVESWKILIEDASSMSTI
jgi:hypothetical protein